jgi:exodeoxyribonuclease V alpha subunit
VLRDVLQHRLAPAVVLDKVHRQAGILKANSSGVLTGKVAPSAGAEQGWMMVDGFRDPLQIQAYLHDLFRNQQLESLGFNPLRDVQVITPTHKGPLGTRELNRQLQFLFHGEVKGRFAIGDKVIQTFNDYELGVMNGTIGFVAEAIEKGFVINFDGVGFRVVEGEQLLNVQLAYALTAHKCQGSEFPCGIVICHKSHFFADRNWLYTAVTRAGKTCILLGDAWGIQHAAKKNLAIQRRTLLSKWAGEDQN